MFKTSGLVTLEVFEMVQKEPLLVQLEVHEIGAKSDKREHFQIQGNT